MGRPDFDIQIVHQVSEFDQEHWDSLSQNRPFASHRWYRFAEITLEKDTPLYIILTRQGEPIARATFWLTRDLPLPLPLNATRALLQAAFRRWPLLLCRTPLSGLSGLILPSDKPLREAALCAIADAAQAYSRQQGASFVIFDYLRPSEIQLPNFSQTALPDPETALPISWSSFEEYASQLGKSARKDYHRHCNRAADLGIEIKINTPAANLDAAIALMQNVERHHNLSPNSRTRRALDNTSMVETNWLTAEIGGRMVGCGVLVGDGDHRSLAFLGLDYDVQYVYFQMMYAAIRACIESGVKMLWGGTQAYEFKQRLGFEHIPTNQIVFAANNRLVGRAVRALVTS